MTNPQSIDILIETYLRFGFDEIQSHPFFKDIIVLSFVLLLFAGSAKILYREALGRKKNGFRQSDTFYFYGVFVKRIGGGRKGQTVVAKGRRYKPVRLVPVPRAEDQTFILSVQMDNVIIGHVDRVSGDWLMQKMKAGYRLRCVFWERYRSTDPLSPICAIAVRID